MRNIFMEICQDQEELEHAVALLGIRRIRALFEILDDGQRIGEKPLKVCRLHGNAAAATIERLIGAHERLIEEVIKAELFPCESDWDRAGTPRMAAPFWTGGCHDPPHGSEVTIPKPRGREPNTNSWRSAKLPSKMH
jgi:hypothetical protein